MGIFDFVGSGDAENENEEEPVDEESESEEGLYDKEELKRELDEIREEIADINSLISESNLDQAEQKIEGTYNHIAQVKDKTQSEEFSKIRTELYKQRQQLDNISDSVERKLKKEYEEQVQEKIHSLRSEISEVDSLISDTQLQEADSQLDDIESRLNALEQEHSGYESERIEQLRQSIREKRQKLQRTEPEEQVQEKIHSLRSDLYEIDSFVTDAEYQEAENLVVEIQSEISSLKEQASQKNIDNLKAKLRRLEQKCEERLSKSHVLTQLREMDPYKFEELVAKIWEKQEEGWDARVTSASADGGVDVIATKENVFGEERLHFIQAKRYGENTKVGSEDMQKYSGLYTRDEDPDAVFVVTSNRFTKDAKDEAEKRDVRLVDCDELYEILTET